MSDLREVAEDVLYLLRAWERGADADDYWREIEDLRQDLAQPAHRRCVLLTPKDSSEDRFNRR